MRARVFVCFDLLHFPIFTLLETIQRWNEQIIMPVNSTAEEEFSDFIQCSRTFLYPLQDLHMLIQL